MKARPAAAWALFLAVVLVGVLSPSAHAAPLPGRFFAPDSIWNAPVPTDAPLAPRSRAFVRALASEVRRDFRQRRGPWINTARFGVPIYTVGPKQPTVTVRLIHSEEAALDAAWQAVPLPSQAKPAKGSEHLLVVWQPSTDRIWEFRRLRHTKQGWTAIWGGAIEHASRNPGVYGPDAWPGARTWWGADGSSFSILGGLITLADLARGSIDHALVISVRKVRERLYTTPAERTNGNSRSALSLPMGAHLRLDPTLDLASLHLPPLTLMLARAAQRYGIFVGSPGSTVAFYGQDPRPTHKNLYWGRRGYYHGMWPNQLLVAFPWRHLQVLKMSLHVDRGAAAWTPKPTQPPSTLESWAEHAVSDALATISERVPAALLVVLLAILLVGLIVDRLTRARREERRARQRAH
jgi:hypothetical protein